MKKWCIYCKWYIEDEYMCINSESRHYKDPVGKCCGCEKFKNLKDKAENCERRNGMTFQELLKVLDEKMFLVVSDANTEHQISGGVGNSIIQRLDGEVKCIAQLPSGAIVVKVDFADTRGEE